MTLEIINVHLLLGNLATTVKSQGLKMKEEMNVKNAEEFIQLHKDSWKYDMGSCNIIHTFIPTGHICTCQLKRLLSHAKEGY